MRYVVLAAAVLLPVAAWSQDLAAAAKKEKERRAAAKSPQGPVYTDEDLPESASPSPKPAKTAPSKSTTKKAAPIPSGEPEPDAEGEESVDARYRRLAAPIKERLDQCQSWLADTQLQLKAAEKRVEEMRADFYVTVEGEWAKARVAELKAEAERVKHDCDEIEDEGRQAGIPPGYLR
jgi:hypothetical protein